MGHLGVQYGVAASPPHIDHIGIVVHDADKACEFYRGLGFTVRHDEVLEHIAVRLVYLDSRPIMIQLVQPIGEGAVAQFLTDRGEGLHHICFVVDTIDDFLHDHPAEIAPVFQGGRGRAACFVASEPNRVLVELTEHTPRIVPAESAR